MAHHRLLWLVSAVASLQLSVSRKILVGGPDGWTPGRTYSPIQASVGDVLTFKWAPGQHNVAEIGSLSCDEAENSRALFDITATPADVLLDSAGTRNFTCTLPGTEASEERLRQHFLDLIRPGVGHCDAAIVDNTSGLHSRSCYSPPITLRPGQIEDAFYFLPSPYPEGQTVGAVRHTSAILDKATGQEVPLSEVYMHHIFGPGDFLVGEGAEHRGSMHHAPLQHPYYTTIPADKFTPKDSRLINVHVISTLGVPEDKVMPCIECWCQDERITARGKFGGGACCSSSLCPSMLPNTTETTYLLQYNVSYRVLEPGMDVTSIYSLMLDAVNGSIEYDIKAADGAEGAVTRMTGALDARCPQTQPLRMLRCLGHQHIGGRGMRLLNNATGEVLCQSNTTYGSGPRDEIGNEGGYLVAMSLDDKPEPVVLAPGTQVVLESVYATEDHFGVMALYFIDFVGFDPTCPGSAASVSGAAFGPDFAHQKGSAFGFYAGERFMDGEGDAPATETKTAEKLEQQTVQQARKGLSTAVLAWLVAGGALLAAAAAAAGVLLYKRRQRVYTLLSPPSSRSHSEQP